MGHREKLDVLDSLTAQASRPWSAMSPGTGLEHTREQHGAGVLDMRCLFSHPEVKVAIARLTAGADLACHNHDGDEWVFIAGGRCEFWFPETETQRFLSGGESIHIPPGVAHEVKVLADTVCIGVTMPADAGYPNGEQ